MTRKDYVLIAAALADAKLHRAVRPDAIIQHSTDCNYLAAALSQDNPRFDRERFLKACGVAS